jgi:hypothetical protein
MLQEQLKRSEGELFPIVHLILAGFFFCVPHTDMLVFPWYLLQRNHQIKVSLMNFPPRSKLWKQGGDGTQIQDKGI